MTELQEIYHAGWQLKKLRMLTWFLFLCFAGSIYAGYSLFYSFGLNPADGYGGQLAPVSHRIAVSCGVAALGAVFYAAIVIFGRFYVSRILVSEDGQTVRFCFVGTIIDPCLDFRAEDIDDVTSHSGYRSNGPSTPWTGVRLKGRRWPKVVDDQGEVTNHRLYRRLMSGRR